MTRWLAYINLFDFDVRHVSGKSHTAADGLSRRPSTGKDYKDTEEEIDIEDFLDAELGCIAVDLALTDDSEEIPVLEGKFSEESIQIATYLTTLRRPTQMNTKEFKKFKTKALHFKVVDQILFRRNSKNVPLRRIVDDKTEKMKIIKALHDESGHKGREGTF